MRRKTKERIYKRQLAIGLLAFNLAVNQKITDEEYRVLVTDSLGTLNDLGGEKMVSRAREELNKIIEGENNNEEQH